MIVTAVVASLRYRCWSAAATGSRKWFPPSSWMSTGGCTRGRALAASRRCSRRPTDPHDRGGVVCRACRPGRLVPVRRAAGRGETAEAPAGSRAASPTVHRRLARRRWRIGAGTTPTVARGSTPQGSRHRAVLCSWCRAPVRRYCSRRTDRGIARRSRPSTTSPRSPPRRTETSPRLCGRLLNAMAVPACGGWRPAGR